MSRRLATGGGVLLALAALAACEQPDEPDRPRIETVYLLDRIDGEAPPAPVCEEDVVDHILRFESIALADDGSYGRLQEVRIGDDPPTRQEERGEFERTADSILLRSGAGGVVTLALLDSAGDFARRIHTCGDTLRYASEPVIE